MSAKHSAALARRWSDPIYREKQIAVLRQNNAARRRKNEEMTQKGRTPPPAQIDHAAQLRERLGKVAYEAAFDHEPVPWTEAGEPRRERYRTIAQAVMGAIVTGGRRQGQISVASTYGATTQKPYVELTTDVSPLQLSPAKAREIALMLLEAADASESDALLARFARETLNLDQVGQAKLIDQFRRTREQQRGETIGAA